MSIKKVLFQTSLRLIVHRRSTQSPPLSRNRPLFQQQKIKQNAVDKTTIKSQFRICVAFLVRLFFNACFFVIFAFFSISHFLGNLNPAENKDKEAGRESSFSLSLSLSLSLSPSLTLPCSPFF
jgi:hypothetical protein